MAIQYFVSRNDTAPAVVDTLQDYLGVAVNLTGATVRFHMTDRYGATKVNALATGPSGGALDTTGQVQYQWVAADTDTAGEYLAEWQVTFQNGKVETWPDNDHATVFVTADLI